MKLRKSLITLVIGIMSVWGSRAQAQSNLKEGFNQFALYSKSGDIKLLDNARKHIDDAYKTRKDTTAFRNNLLRSLVYSTYAVVDSNRSKKYSEDPIIIASRALSKLKDKQLVFESEPEINYVKRYLSNAHLISGNRALAKKDYKEAYKRFYQVDSIGSISSPELRYNLAVLSQKTGKTNEAIRLYSELIENSKTSNPKYYTALADIYQEQNNKNLLFETLKKGRNQFQNNREILFRLVDFYQKNAEYVALLDIIESAIKMDNQNTYLYYLAGYSEDLQGNFERAKAYYLKVIELDPNHFNSNYALGLLFLREYLEDSKNRSFLTKAEDYLLRANQIEPTAKNALQSLAILYKKDNNIIQLERVNNILNQQSF